MQCPNALAPNEAPVKCIETSGEVSLVRSLNGQKIMLELVNYGVYNIRYILYMIPSLKVRQQKRTTCLHIWAGHQSWRAISILEV